jgi:antitoxin component YwqK of YwqJK toxin-antitoxin module
MLMKNILNNGREHILTLNNYPNGQLAVYLKDNNGYPIAELSIMEDDIHLNRNEFIFKNYSENNDLSQELLNTNIIKPTNKFVIIGSHLCPICYIANYV